MHTSDIELPQYSCRKIDRPITLTGRIDDPQWQQAEVVMLNDIHGKPGRYATKVRSLWDDAHLWLSFDCEDTYAWATRTGRNAAVWEEECVEVFINPGNTIHQYYEINVNPLNTVFDACIINGRTQQYPDAGFIGFPDLDLKDLRTAVHVNGELNRDQAAKGWCVEMAIPFIELFGAVHVPPQPGDEWRVNFYRIDYPFGGKQEHYCWSRVDRIAFHLPWRFGVLRFDQDIFTSMEYKGRTK